MSSSLEECLSRVGFYQNVSRLRRDMQTLLYNCSTLRPNVNVFQSSSGNITLFYLTGVLPINYQGATYNIPVSIYLDPPYPAQPPRVFVTPTAQMAIKANHKSVDMNGRVYLPQLSGWNAHSSSLVEVVGVLTSIFSANPPVVAVRCSPTVIQGTVITANSGVAIPRKEILLKSLKVKVRAKLPVVLKSHVDSINEGKLKNFRFTQKVSLLDKSVSDCHLMQKRIAFSMSKLNTLEGETSEWIGKQTQSVSDPGVLAPLTFLEASSVVGQQVLDLIAEEAAIEDLIDYLGQLAREQKISTSDFFKETRSLNRKLFETKYLTRKAVYVLQKYSAI